MEKERKRDEKRGGGKLSPSVSGRQPSAQSGPVGTHGLYTCSNQLAAASPWTRPLEVVESLKKTGSSAAGRDQDVRSKEAAAGRTPRTTPPPS